MWLLLLLQLQLMYSPPQCRVRVVPAVAVAPLTYVRATTTIEEGDWRSADVCLLDSGDQVLRCSRLFEGDAAQHRPRVQQIEWRYLLLPADTYAVRLTVSMPGGSCTANAPITVQGNNQ